MTKDVNEYGYSDNESDMIREARATSAEIDHALAEVDFNLLFEEWELKYFAKSAYVESDFMESLRSTAVHAVRNNSYLTGVLYRLRNSSTDRVLSVSARVCRIDDLDRFVRAAACSAPSLKWVSGYNLSALTDITIDEEIRTALGNLMAGAKQADYQTPSNVKVEGRKIEVASWNGRTQITVVARPEWGGYFVNVEFENGSRNKADTMIRHLIENGWSDVHPLGIDWA